MIKKNPYSVLLYISLVFFGLSCARIPRDWIKGGVEGEYISPLMKAAKEGNCAVLKSLDANMINLKQQSRSRMTALHYAIGFGKVDAALYLIKQGAPINVMDQWDNTPLFMARQRKQIKVIEALEEAFLRGQHLGKNFTNDNDKHFILLVASFNNVPWHEKNLDMIFSQDYDKVTVIYMDDLSNDGTYKRVLEYFRKRKLGHRIILIKNKVKRFCLGNYLFAIERFCPDKAVLVTYDGDDWFNCDHALSTVNKVYQDPKIWMTYGNSIMYPQNIAAPFCLPIDPSLLLNKTFRQKCKNDLNWPIHHLRSFYTALFRKINPADLIDLNHKPYMFAEDVAYMSAMIEMAALGHYAYIKEPLYVYNMKNPLITTNRFGNKEIHKKFRFICDKKPYEPLNSLF